MKQSTVILSRDTSWGSRQFIFQQLSHMLPLKAPVKIIHFLCTSSEVKEYLQNRDGLDASIDGLCFYILGDFVFDLDNWLVIFRKVLEKRVHFFVLSEPQKKHFLKITGFKDEMVSVVDPLISQINSNRNLQVERKL